MVLFYVESYSLYLMKLLENMFSFCSSYSSSFVQVNQVAEEDVDKEISRMARKEKLLAKESLCWNYLWKGTVVLLIFPPLQYYHNAVLLEQYDFTQLLISTLLYLVSYTCTMTYFKKWIVDTRRRQLSSTTNDKATTNLATSSQQSFDMAFRLKLFSLRRKTARVVLLDISVWTESVFQHGWDRRSVGFRQGNLISSALSIATGV